MVTALPPNSGGYITHSFEPNKIAKANLFKLFTMSSKARSALCDKHSQYVGYYGTTQRTGKGFKITPMLLPIGGLDDSSGVEIETFAATLSNVASDGRVVLVQHAQMCGSTIRLVSQDFAKTLPAKIPKGKAFKNSVQKIVAIKSLLPADSDVKNYVLILCPNVMGIPAGEAETVKGEPDDNMAEHFRDISEHALAWMMIQTEGHEGVLPFSADLQKLCVDNRTLFGAHYPKYAANITLTPTQLFNYTSPPAEDDEEDAIYTTMIELRAQLKAAVVRNTGPLPSRGDPLGLNVDLDMDSVLDLGLKQPPATTSNTERQEAKLRLMCAGYCPTKGVHLFDLKDSIKEVLSERKDHQPESLSNQLASTSTLLAQSMDAVNRSANWPIAYADTP